MGFTTDRMTFGRMQQFIGFTFHRKLVFRFHADGILEYVPRFLESHDGAFIYLVFNNYNQDFEV